MAAFFGQIGRSQEEEVLAEEEVLLEHPFQMGHLAGWHRRCDRGKYVIIIAVAVVIVVVSIIVVVVDVVPAVMIQRGDEIGTVASAWRFVNGDATNGDGLVVLFQFLSCCCCGMNMTSH